MADLADWGMRWPRGVIERETVDGGDGPDTLRLRQEQVRLAQVSGTYDPFTAKTERGRLHLEFAGVALAEDGTEAATNFVRRFGLLGLSRRQRLAVEVGAARHEAVECVREMARDRALSGAGAAEWEARFRDIMQEREQERLRTEARSAHPQVPEPEAIHEIVAEAERLMSIVRLWRAMRADAGHDATKQALVDAEAAWGFSRVSGGRMESATVRAALVDWQLPRAAWLPTPAEFIAWSVSGQLSGRVWPRLAVGEGEPHPAALVSWVATDLLTAMYAMLSFDMAADVPYGQCVECGRPFHSRRRGRTYCTTTCANRQRQRRWLQSHPDRGRDATKGRE